MGVGGWEGEEKRIWAEGGGGEKRIRGWGEGNKEGRRE